MTSVTTAFGGSPPGARRNSAIAMIDEGNALEEQGRIPEAMGCYEAAVDADPQCARAHHVQEHCLTLGQIESFLAELGLRLIGFELDPRVLLQFRERFTDDLSGTNLRNWARFEADNPYTFTGMYQFWIQQPISR